MLDPKEAEDRSLIEAAQSIFGDDLIEIGEEDQPDLSSVPAIVTPDERAAFKANEVREVQEMMGEMAGMTFGRPGVEDMITVRGGGLYLPVRRRVVWMRGEPHQHPDWTIETEERKVVEGVFKGGKVEGGYARYKAFVYDETGRLIATGTKTEYSERFMDFCEKAETGAIGRALAIAGYGTEAAVDLDEGLEQERIADAPVDARGRIMTRPINITSSAVEGLAVGGRSENVTEPQLREIARLSRSLKLGLGLISVVENLTAKAMPPMDDKTDANGQMLSYLRTLTFEEASTVIGKLSQVLADRQRE